jgi:hypothetical protein
VFSNQNQNTKKLNIKFRNKKPAVWLINKAYKRIKISFVMYWKKYFFLFGVIEFAMNCIGVFFNGKGKDGES